MKILKIMDGINEWAGKLISLLVCPCILVILVDVVLRYGFGKPTIWAHETSTFLFSAIAVTGGGYVFLHGGHIVIDVLSGRLQTRKRAILEMVLSIFIFFFASILLWQGTSALLLAIDWNSHTQSQWGPPWWPLIMFVPIGAILLIIGGISKFIKDLFAALGKRGYENLYNRAEIKEDS